MCHKGTKQLGIIRNILIRLSHDVWQGAFFLPFFSTKQSRFCVAIVHWITRVQFSCSWGTTEVNIIQTNISSVFLTSNSSKSCCFDEGLRHERFALCFPYGGDFFKMISTCGEQTPSGLKLGYLWAFKKSTDKISKSKFLNQQLKLFKTVIHL